MGYGFTKFSPQVLGESFKKPSHISPISKSNLLAAQLNRQEEVQE